MTLLAAVGLNVLFVWVRHKQQHTNKNQMTTKIMKTSPASAVSILKEKTTKVKNKLNESIHTIQPER